MPETLLIVKEPDKILRKAAATVSVGEITGRRIQRLILGMKKTLENTPDGVGLAAPQIGESLRIFIVSSEAEEIDKIEKMFKKSGHSPQANVEKDEKPYQTRKWRYYVFINPAVKKISKNALERNEGCLSVPGKFGAVRRREKIIIEAYDERGQKFVRGSSGFFARVIQHELDHLQGALFIDKAKKVFGTEPAS